MPTTIELRESAAVLATEARSEFEKIKPETPDNEAKEIENRFDQIMSDHDKLISQADRQERLECAESRSSEGVHGDPGRGADSAGGDASGEGAVDYREAFYEYIRCGAEISEMKPEARQALRQGATEVRAQSTTASTAGGLTVPDTLQNVLIETMKMHGPMYDPGITTEMNTASGGQIKLPTIDDTSQTGSARSELAPINDDGSKDATFGQRFLDAFVYDTEFVKWSMELAQDSIFNMEALLNTLLGKRLGRLGNHYLTVGSGSNEPHGIVTASSLGVTAVGASSIIPDELIDLQHSVDPAYRAVGSVAYMMNDLTLSYVRKLKNENGDYIWQMGDIQRGIPQTLNGVPIVINQAMPNMGTGARPILFGDFSQYFVRKVGSPIMGVMRERFWPDLGICGLIRFDGELGDDAAVKHLVMA